MPSLYDNLFAGPLQPGGDDTTSHIKTLLSRSGGLESLLPTAGLPKAFEASQQQDFVQPQHRSPVVPMAPLHTPNMNLEEAIFDPRTSVDKLRKIYRPKTDDPTAKTAATRNDLLQRLIDLTLRPPSDQTDDSGVDGSYDVGSPPVRTKRYASPLDAPDTGEEVVDMPGVPRGYFSRVLGPESSGRMDAINPISKALGLYQFLPSTLAALKKANPDLVIDGNWKKDRAQQDSWMRAYTQQSLDALKSLIGERTPSYGELYAMHFFGQKGGAGLISNKDKKLKELLPDIVFQWNPRLNRNQTAGDFIDAINKAWGEP